MSCISTLVNKLKYGLFLVLYTNIDLKLRNKSHGPMHYKIDVTCVFNGYKIIALF